MKSIADLPRDLKGFKFSGVVTRVGDGDGFKIFHVPWLRSSKYNKASPKLSVRLAGIDAPEVRYFNKPEQIHAKESRDYLCTLVHGKKVHVEALKLDMYNRILAFAHVKTGWFTWTNVNIKMVKEGMACVYVAAGAEYGKYKNELKQAEAGARKKKLGMWKNGNAILPSEHKKMYR